MSLYGDFLSPNHRRSHKWFQYFAAYEQHFERFKNRHITVFEIGIGEGGSLQSWRRYFGPFAVIVGIDINPKCKQVEEDQIHVRIGSQTDTAFLAGLLAEFGNPDIVIDDGSHIQSDIIASFEFLYPYVNKNGVYLVEDLHAAYWPQTKGGLHDPNSFIERAKGFVDQMHAEYTWADYPGGDLPRTTIGDRTRSIHFYDSIVVLEVGEYRPKRQQLTGDASLFNGDWTPPPESGVTKPARVPETLAEQSAPQGVLDLVVRLQKHVRRLEAAAGGAVPALDAPPKPDRSAALQARIGVLEHELAVVRASTSWRITEPLRALGRMLGKK